MNLPNKLTLSRFVHSVCRFEMDPGLDGGDHRCAGTCDYRVAPAGRIEKCGIGCGGVRQTQDDFPNCRHYRDSGFGELPGMGQGWPGRIRVSSDLGCSMGKLVYRIV